MASFDFNNLKLKHHEVRLLPTFGIKGEKEAEMRATSALLAMVRAVAEFGGIIIKQASGPGGKAKNVQCYTEVNFLPDFPEDNEPARPDGIIRRKYGEKEWKAFVEVKVGSNIINENQIDNYMRWANPLNFDALITVSNQNNLPDGTAPYRHKKGKVKVRHFSWEEIHSIAQRLIGKDDGIGDTDQRWMLEQFDQYLVDENSMIITPPSLGDHWHDILRHVKANTLNVQQDMARDLVKHWRAFLQTASLRLEAEIGRTVRVRISEKFRNDPDRLFNTECKQTIDTGCLSGCLIFPGTGMDDIQLYIDLKTEELQLSHRIIPPDDGRRDTRVNWMIREMRKLEKVTTVPPKLRIKVDWKKYGLKTSAFYKDLSEDIIPLLRGKSGMQVDKDVMPKRFSPLELETPLQGARGKGSVQELKGVLGCLEDFYRLIQPINRPAPKPSPLSKGEETSPQEMDEQIIDKLNQAVSGQDIGTDESQQETPEMPQ